MAGISSFHEIDFPLRIAMGAGGGPVRQTQIVPLGSGHEQRNARWSRSRRRFDAGFGVRSLDDLYEVVAFFEARMGRLIGFRFRDSMDHKSCAPGSAVSPLDQQIGTGDGTTGQFQLIRRYGSHAEELPRTVFKPVAGSVRIAVDGGELEAGADFDVDAASGIVTFAGGAVPGPDQNVTAGYVFDLPARFDTDSISANRVAFDAGEIPSIPIVELLQ
jgi:uncharacterized protein (TIGR02217 family)